MITFSSRKDDNLNLIDSSITKGISIKYFVHYKTKEESKSYDPFCSAFFDNIKELSKNNWKFHQRLVCKVNPSNIAKAIRSDDRKILHFLGIPLK